MGKRQSIYDVRYRKTRENPRGGEECCFGKVCLTVDATGAEFVDFDSIFASFFVYLLVCSGLVEDGEPR
jgi:hypothetical protein